MTTAFSAPAIIDLTRRGLHLHLQARQTNDWLTCWRFLRPRRNVRKRFACRENVSGAQRQLVFLRAFNDDQR
jgi:hypothetical protein